MSQLTWLLVGAGMVGMACRCGAGDLVMDHQRDAQSLAGGWERLLEHGDHEVWRPDVAAEVGPWKTVDIPGSNLMAPEPGQGGPAARQLAEKTAYVWLRRSLDVDAAHAARDAVLKWGGIRFGATAWINGNKVAEHVPVGPMTALLPRGTLKAGRNEIVLRIPGWAGVPKSKSGYPLTPTGGATQSWGGKGPGVYNDIWLEFYDRVYLKWVLAMPDVAGKSVTFRIRPGDPSAVPAGTRLAVEVRETGGAGPVATVNGELRREDAWTDVPCTLSTVKPWTHKSPHLYEATVRATIDGKPCDEVRFAFGMREIGVKHGRFTLNGRPLWLRGSNLVNEWLWGDKFNENVKQYIVDEARSMNLNCFRTHTQPPPATWLNVTDQNGTMILAEMPLLYNHADFQYTTDELEVLHKNALLDAEGWVTRMWNHPSIVMWVLSNESRCDNEWEAGPLWEFVKDLDPTRPSMRTGEDVVGTPDVVDVHTCFNVVRGAEGQLIVDMMERMRRKDPARPLTNTEYMNHMWDPSGRWLGREKDPGMPLAYAMCATEHTEAMRRLGFDCLLPYMYAGWTRLRGRTWRDDYPTPMAAALHSSMAPVLASLDMFDPNYAAGETIDVPLVLINELHDEVAGKLDLYVTPRHPLFIPDPEALAAALWHDSQEVVLDADSIRTMKVRIPVPKAEGSYYAAAVLSRYGDTPVVSQRILRSVDRTKSLEPLKGRKVLVLAADSILVDWLKAAGAVPITCLTTDKIDADVALIWSAASWSETVGKTVGALREFAESGGRVVVADRADWPWNELADCRIGLPEFTWRNPVICSRAHAFEGADHPMLRNIPADWLWRWNGLPGAIANEVILEGAALEQGKKILWASRPVYTAALSVPVGKGEVVFCQLQIRGRVGEKSTSPDPVAERILANLLAL